MSWLAATGVLVLDLLLRLTLGAVILVRSRKAPSVRLAWLAVVLAVPFLGVLAYLAVGEIRLGRRRVRRYRRVVDQVVHLLGPDLRGAPAEVPEGARRVAALGEKVAWPPSGGNRLRLFGDTDEAVTEIIGDIDAARSSCHLLFYIYLPDGNGSRVGEALMRAAGRGVTCRLLVDGTGSKDLLRSDLCRLMQSRGVLVTEALPVNPFRRPFARLDLRNHRKIVVIDGEVGWTGSQNLADAEFAIKADYAPWVDVMVRIEGPAVHDLQVLFTVDWLLDHDEPMAGLLTQRPPPLAGGVAVQIVPSGPHVDHQSLRYLMAMAFQRANRELIVTTPYFVPDVAMASALYATARAGVDTSLVVPARNDSPLVAAASRSYYSELLASGVKIYEYRRGLLHAKTFTIDGVGSVVATANLDRRSFELNFEVAMIVYDQQFTHELRRLQIEYIEQSHRVHAEAWDRKGWRRRLVYNAAGLLSPLL